ncbi:MAG: hypothetical protein RLZZ587_142 [Actinomycetota bacterium]
MIDFRVFGLALTGLFGLTGCAASPQSHSAMSLEQVPTVVAQTRTIVSIVTSKGSVVAQPEFVATAGETGSWKSTVPIGRHVQAGATLGKVGTARVLAPSDGIVTSLPAGSIARVGKGVPVVVMRFDGFGVIANFPLELGFRVYSEPTTGRVSLTNGASSVKCTPTLPVSIAATDLEGAASALSMLCLLPLDTEALYVGMPATLGLNTGIAKDVVSIPTSAVSGSREKGTVARIVNGERQVIEVELGMTDGSWIEVTSGLEPGDEVQGLAPDITEGMRW